MKYFFLLKKSIPLCSLLLWSLVPQKDMIYYQDIDFGREKSNSYEIKNSAGG
jgi:hypothetical protein